MKIIERLKQKATNLKIEVYALYLAYKDPRVPWYAKIFIACVVGYALSPIDLIPDGIPIIGYLDDLILVPLGIAIALRMIPSEVMNEYRVKAKANISQDKPVNWIAAGIIFVIWMLLAALVVMLILRGVRK
jgi:uncharacterized membrane protein YkvA (DUF1232 family)